MTRIPLKPRLNQPRDLQVGYTLSRMVAATTVDMWPLFYGSAAAARFGMIRLFRLRLVVGHDRRDPSEVKWWSLSKEGRTWVAEETGCDERDIRLVTGLGRMNLSALRMRNRLWVSVILAARSHHEVKLERFITESELRAARTSDVSICPDALVTLATKNTDTPIKCSFMVELDSGSERSVVLTAKARAYAAHRSTGLFYGVVDWHVLVVVPSWKRAATVALAVVDGGAGTFTMIAVESEIDMGRVFEPIVALASELARGDVARHSIVDHLVAETPNNAPQQRLLGEAAHK